MNHVINAAIQIVPISQNNDHYAIIDRAIEIIKSSGLQYVVGPMETSIQGDYDTVLKVMKKAQEVCLQAGADELVVTIKIHARKDSDISFEEKISKHNP